MKITRVTTAVIEANFDWTIVRIETDEGLQGFWGMLLRTGTDHDHSRIRAASPRSAEGRELNEPRRIAEYADSFTVPVG